MSQTDDLKIAFLLSLATDHEKIISALEADLKESRSYALALEEELRARDAAHRPPTRTQGDAK